MKLEIGYNSNFEVRKEYFKCNTQGPITILYLSDFHFNKYSQNIALKLAEKIHQIDPDIVLLGGDYIDSKRGLSHFTNLLHSISHRKNIYAIAGNHDYFFGIKKIKEVITANNVCWIEKESISFNLNKTWISINGNNLQKNEDADLNILCMHKPRGLKDLNNHFNLVFAGHLHGGQFVCLQTEKGLYPGRLFYKWNILKTNFNSCLYLVSKGLGDTLPIRYNCPKDIICVYIDSRD